MRHEVEELTVEPVDKAELGLAEPRRTLGNHVKHRLDVGRRATDDPQHLRGRRLLLQHLVALAADLRDVCLLGGSRTVVACGLSRVAEPQRLMAFGFFRFVA